jgi:DNA helicase-4
VNFSDFEFRPDFHIPQADLFLEHVSNLSHPMGDKEWQFQKGGGI